MMRKIVFIFRQTCIERVWKWKHHTRHHAARSLNPHWNICSVNICIKNHQYFLSGIHLHIYNVMDDFSKFGDVFPENFHLFDHLGTKLLRLWHRPGRRPVRRARQLAAPRGGVDVQIPARQLGGGLNPAGCGIIGMVEDIHRSFLEMDYGTMSPVLELDML